jgi:2,4-dienoyl-CoA reductase (NADPH2)
VKLFEPIRIGSMQLKNRIVMSPMTTGYAGKDQRPTERLIRYLEARARGGAGLITLEACVVDRRHREIPRSMHFSDDGVVAAHRALTDAVHAHGAKVQPQIIHAGPDSLSPFFDGIPSVGPSVIPSYLTGHPCRELSAGELPPILDQYAAAVRRVREAGYDGIELHAAHGYMLIGSFLTSWRNKRGDDYTGQTREGRLRFLLEVLAAIRREVGDDFPITLRISGYERVPGGRSIDDTQAVAPRLEAAGVNAFHVSGGVIDRLTSQIVTGSHFGDAHNVAAATAVKRVVDVPVMAVGRIHDPSEAEKILAEGRADLIVMGRPLLADPELPFKVQAGRSSDVRRCISCENCIDSMEVGLMHCAVNGLTGRESELRMERTAEPKRVVVVGAGPAGLEAARIAALRGHRVALYERQRYLGGALVLAATVHPENEPLLRFLVRQVHELGVEIHLGTGLDADTVARIRPDAAVIATGGRVVAPRIPGDEQPHVLSGALLRQMLSGELPEAEARRLPAWQRLAVRTFGRWIQPSVDPALLRRLTRFWMPLGRRVVVIGADLAAIELAEFLARRGREVAILETAGEIAPEVGLKRRTEHMDNLDRLGIPVNTGIEIEEITSAGVAIRPESGGHRVIACDSVIIAGTVEPNGEMFERVKQALPEAHAIGDCTGLGLIRKAIEDATRVACAL